MESKIRGKQVTLVLVGEIEAMKTECSLLLSKRNQFDWNLTGQTQEAFAKRQRQRLLATQQERKKV